MLKTVFWMLVFSVLVDLIWLSYHIIQSNNAPLSATQILSFTVGMVSVSFFYWAIKTQEMWENFCEVARRCTKLEFEVQTLKDEKALLISKVESLEQK